MPPELKRIETIRREKGPDFLDGCKNTVTGVAKVRKGERVLVAGTASHRHFLEALHHYALEAGANSRLVITDHLRDGTKEQGAMAKAAQEHKADVFLFAIDNTPSEINGRFAIYDAIHDANKDVFTITMPGITDKAVSKFLTADSKTIRKHTKKILKRMERLRGEKIEIRTTGPDGKEHVLRGKIPDMADEETYSHYREKHDEIKNRDRIFRILKDDQIRRKGEMINLPGGEVFCPPMEMEGSMFLARGTVVMDHGVLESGLTLKVSHDRKTGLSRIVEVLSHGEADRRVAEKLLEHIKPGLPKGSELQELKSQLNAMLKRELQREPTDIELKMRLEGELERYKRQDVWAELGIGLNPHVDHATNNLEAEKIYGTAHGGIGSNKDEYGIVDANGHGDLVFVNGQLYIGNKLMVDMDKRSVPMLEKPVPLTPSWFRMVFRGAS